MKAVRVTAWGSAPQVIHVPDPAPTEGRTIVRVEAATVGHVDRTIWSGGFLRHPPLPYTPGVEAAGVVVQSDAFSVGERVWVRGGGLGTATDGTWADLVSAPDAAVGRLRDDVSFEIGSAFFSPCTSAWVAVHTIGDLRPGQRVIVTGATGAVGSIATQLAFEAGADVIATVSRAERLAALPEGVQGIVVAAGPTAGDLDWGAEPADLLVDTVGGSVLSSLLPHVRQGGRAVLVGYLAGTSVELDLPTFMQRDVTLHPLNMIRREHDGRAVAGELLVMLAEGRLTLDVTSFELSEASVAMDWLTEPGHLGRAVLTPTFTPPTLTPTAGETVGEST